MKFAVSEGMTDVVATFIAEGGDVNAQIDSKSEVGVPLNIVYSNSAWYGACP